MNELLECDVLLIAHRWFLPDGSAKVGGIDRTKDYLLDCGFGVAFLEHPLTTVSINYDAPTVSTLSIHRRNDRRELARFACTPSSNPWRWIAERWHSPRIVRKHLKGDFVTISADPLCALAASALKRSGAARSCVLHVTDYADQRFSNPLLNQVYQSVCRSSLRSSDLVLCVSRKMIQVFEKRFNSGPYMLFPNTPHFNSCPRLPVAQRRRSEVVLLGVDKEGMRHETLVEAFAQFQSRKPDATLHIIGAGGGDQRIRELAQRAGIGEAVVCHGFLDRSAALELVSQCGVGIVLYDPAVPWNDYRDSLKIREYAACGVPVVSDSSTATAREASDEGAGLLGDDAATIAHALTTLCSNDAEYERRAEAAVAWAKSNDKQIYLEQLMKRIGLEHP